MALMTLAEVRALLQVPAADTSRDTLISTLIPMATKAIVGYTNNSFLALDAQIRSAGIAFVPGSSDTITDEGSGFVTALLAAGDVRVRGSKFNDGIHAVTTVAAGTLTLSSTSALKTEAAGSYIFITQIIWPEELKLDAAQLINYYITTQGKLVSQESMPGGYAAQYKSEAEVMKIFNKYRKPYP